MTLTHPGPRRCIAYRKGAPTDTDRDYELTDWNDLTRFVDTSVTVRQ